MMHSEKTRDGKYCCSGNWQTGIENSGSNFFVYSLFITELISLVPKKYMSEYL